MLGDIFVCALVAALVAAVIVYKVREAKKAKREGRCSACSCCSGSTECAKRAYQFEETGENNTADVKEEKEK